MNFAKNFKTTLQEFEKGTENGEDKVINLTRNDQTLYTIEIVRYMYHFSLKLLLYKKELST